MHTRQEAIDRLADRKFYRYLTGRKDFQVDVRDLAWMLDIPDRDLDRDVNEKFRRLIATPSGRSEQSRRALRNEVDGRD